MMSSWSSRGLKRMFASAVDEDEQLEEEKPVHRDIPNLTKCTKYTFLEEKFIVASGQLECLLEMVPLTECAKCGKPLSKTITKIGCIIKCKWVCNTSFSILIALNSIKRFCPPTT
ncbi:hypothetical protein DPMN_138024 [Dreissena polymorpha]|uniref:Uncharacterized protein n=1 Tax=Dreissena polymorpha TaxID=45954 RepID=A0A9D4G303_DREPO|nr:hypothetical protein DPMN_138024 [Dreissena polymorpha]